MSTKIYNGYRLPVMTALEIQELSMDLRSKIDKKFKELYYKELAYRTVRMIDRITSEDLDVKELLKRTFSLVESIAKIDIDDYINWSMLSLNKMYATYAYEYNRKASVDTIYGYDYKFNIVLFPIKRKLLCMVFSSHMEFTKIFEDTTGAKYYGYQNQTDKPDDISYSSWERRKLDWEEALPGIGIPSLSGLTVECMPSYLPTPSTDEIVNCVTSLENRLKKAAENVVFERRCKELKDIHVPFEWLRSDEGKKQVELEIESVRQKIIMDPKEILEIKASDLIKRA